MAKSVSTTCKVPFSPSLTYFPATFGCTYLVTVLQQKPRTPVWELPPSTIPWEKTRSPVEPKEVSLGKVSGGMPSPLLSPCRKPQVNGPVPWKSLGVPASLRLSEWPPAGPWAAQEKRRKEGKLTLLVLCSQHHKPWEQTLNHKTDWYFIRNMSTQVSMARKPALNIS